MPKTERFKRLSTLPANLYRQGCPVLVEAGALLLDQQVGKTLVQLRLSNVSAAPLAGIKLTVECLDMEGLVLGTAEAAYPDLALRPGESTGDRVPVYLAHANARSLRLWVTTVVERDGQVWKNDAQEPFQPLPEQPAHTLPAELVGEYREEAKEAGCTKGDLRPPQEAQGLWQCGCGSWNAIEAEKCLHCGLSHQWQKEHLTEEGLRQRFEERTQRKAEQARREAEAAQKKAEADARKAAEVRAAREKADAEKRAAIKKWGIIGGAAALVIAVVLLVTQVIIPGNIRKEALAQIENGQYAEAQLTFSRLDNGNVEFFGVMKEHGDALTRSARYDEAIEAYDFIGHRWDVDAVKLKQITKYKAAGEYQSAMDVLATVGMNTSAGSKRSMRDEQNDLLVAWANALTQQGEYDTALEKLELWSSENAIGSSYQDRKEAGWAAWLAKGDALLASGSYVAASDAYLMAEDKARSAYALGRSYEAAGHYGLAAQEYQKCADHTALDAQQRYESCKALSLVNPQVGDVVWMGKVQGVGGAPHRWQVLAIDGDRALLQSMTTFYEGPAMSSYGDKMDWVNSPMRSRLNQELLYDCFTPQEQALILSTPLQNDSGTTTNDRLFLLSKREVETYLPTEDARDAIGTGWWTRSFAGSDDAWRVSYGELTETFTAWDEKILPAMWVLYLQSEEETIADAAARVMKPAYDQAVAKMEAGDYAAAIEGFNSVSTYRDAQLKIYTCYELMGDGHLEAGDYAAAILAYDNAFAYQKTAYAEGCLSLQQGDAVTAAGKFIRAGDVLDAPQQLYLCQLKQLTAAEPGDVVWLGDEDVPLMVQEKKVDGENMVWISYTDPETGSRISYTMETELFMVDGVPELTQQRAVAVMEAVAPGLLPTRRLLPWVVVEVKGSEALLMAQKPVAQLPFHDTWEPVTWADCTLRAWLNEKYLPYAFTEELQALLVANETVPGFEDLLFLPPAAQVDPVAAQKMNAGEVSAQADSDTAQALRLRETYAKLDTDGYERLLTLTPGDTADYVQTLWLSSVRSSYSTPEYLPLYVNEPCAVYPLIRVRTDKEAEIREQARLAGLYADAEALLAAGDYAAAEAAFLALGEYESSAEKAAEAGAKKNAEAYAAAEALLTAGDYTAAEAAFLILGEYQDSTAKAAEAVALQQAAAYAAAEALLTAGDYTAAEAAFLALGEYEDSTAKAAEAREIMLRAAYEAADALLTAGDYAAAEAAFLTLGEYEDSAAKAAEAHEVPRKAAYEAAEAAFAEGDYRQAADSYLSADDYSDAAGKAAYVAAELEQFTGHAEAYQAAVALAAEGRYAEACDMFLDLGDFRNSKQQAACAMISVGAFDRLSAPYNGAYLYIKDDLLGYVNTQTGFMRYGDLGEAIVLNEWDASGYVTFMQEGKYGILRADGQIVSPCKWSKVTFEADGMAVVTDVTDSGVLDPDGNVLIPVAYQAVKRISDNVWMTSLDLWVDGAVRYQSSEHMLLPTVSPQGTFVWPCNDGKWRLLNARAEVLYESDVPLSKQCYGTTVIFQDVETGKWGMLDAETGKVLMKPTYPELNESAFSADGTLVNSYRDQNGSWKHIMLNYKGEKVASFKNSPQPRYDFFKLDSTRGEYVYLNGKGKTVADSEKYQQLTPLSWGCIAAEGEEKSSKSFSGKVDMVYLLDKNGKQIWKQEAAWIDPVENLPGVCTFYDGVMCLVCVDADDNTHVIGLYEHGVRKYTFQPMPVKSLPGDYLLVAAHPQSESGKEFIHRFVRMDQYTNVGEVYICGNLIKVGADGIGAACKAGKWQPVRFNGTTFEPCLPTAEDLSAAPVSIAFPETLP